VLAVALIVAAYLLGAGRIVFRNSVCPVFPAKSLLQKPPRRSISIIRSSRDAREQAKVLMDFLMTPQIGQESIYIVDRINWTKSGRRPLRPSIQRDIHCGG
jgi:hypothetical protein